MRWKGVAGESGGPDPQHHRRWDFLRAIVGAFFGVRISRGRFLRGGDASHCGECGSTCEDRKKNTVPHKVLDYEERK